MKKDNEIRSAIDESLSPVRFDASDMRAVLRQTRSRREAPAAPSRRRTRFDMALAMTLLLMLVVPLGYFALRAQGMRSARITAAPGTEVLAPLATADPQADPIIGADDAFRTADEREAIRIARACFESVCDTGVFTFGEYAVSAGVSSAGEGVTEYRVQMDCIYGNGCRFTVQVALPEGRVLSHSAPALATMPTYLDSSAPQVAAWYDRYGPYILTWPQDAQAEFSRRYEGAMLRAALPGEMPAAQAVELALALFTAQQPSFRDNASLCGYPLLYAERAAADGLARYAVSIFAESITDTLPQPLGTVSFRPDGSDPRILLP